MGKVLKIVAVLFEGVMRLGYLLVALAVIVAVAYVLGGYAYLVQGRWGTDTWSALSMMAWIDKYFPQVPFWDPLVGGGVSITHSYPMLAFYLVSALRRLFSLELTTAMQILGMAAILASAVGIYTWVAWRFRNQTAALIAAICYLISPITWTWLVNWGFYAEVVSYLFAVPAMMFWDIWFQGWLKEAGGIKQRGYLILAAGLTSLALLAHYITGLGLLVLYGFWVIGGAVRRKGLRKAWARGIVAFLSIGILVGSLTSFIIVPLNRYFEIAGQAAPGGGPSRKAMMESAILPGHLLGFDLPEKGEFLYASKNISFVPMVVIMALIGGVVYAIWKRNSTVISLGLYVGYVLLLLGAPELIFWIRDHWELLSRAVGTRPALVALRIALPVLAGLGAVALFELGFFWVKGKYINWVRKLLVSGGGLLLFALVMVKWGNFPEVLDSEYRFGARGLDLGNIWQDEQIDRLGNKLDLTTQLEPANWPKMQLSKMPPMPEEGILKVIEGDNPQARLDFSAHASSHSMIAPYFNLNTSLSQIHYYVPTSSLMLRFAGQQSNAFYANDPFYGHDVNLINDWTRWFGITHIWLSGQEDEVVPKLFEEAGWAELSNTGGSKVLKFPEENRLVELSNKQAVLVISQDRLGAYDQIYRLAGHGMLPFEKTLLVRGKGKVDDYTQEELASFDVLLLDGYGYKNFDRANALLSEYVKSGGSVFVDTGWQYQVPDWETQEGRQPLEIIPVTKLEWKDLGKVSKYDLRQSNISNDIDVTQIAPLAYEGQPWSVSTAGVGEIEDWANPVLGTGGNWLVAEGQFGEGRVVWSGMNLIAHAKQGDNFYWQEIKLLTNAFNWLTGDEPNRNWSVSYLRLNPDRVEFTINEDLPTGGWLLWKEARFPDFVATLSNNSSPLPVYRAGPGMSLIRLPQVSRGEKIIYQYRKPWLETVAKLISLVTLILILPLLIIDGCLGKRSIVARLTGWLADKLDWIFFRIWKIPATWWKKNENDGDYE